MRNSRLSRNADLQLDQDLKRLSHFCEGKSDPPPAPDYIGAAQAQGTANKEAAQQTAFLGNPNIYSPYGTQTVSYENRDGNLFPTVTQTLNPQSQQIFDRQQNVKLGLAGLGGQALSTAQGVMGTPFSFGGPGIQTSLGDSGSVQGLTDASQYNAQTGVSGGQIQGAPNLFGFGQAGADVTRAGINYGPTGNQYGMASNVGGSQYGSAGAVGAGQFGLAQGGPSAGQYGFAQGGPDGPQLQSQIDLSGIANMPINAGTTAQQAIMSRLEPSMQRQRTATETQLINQGLRPGTEAYNNAANLLGQQENDQRTQAALQGLGLDMSANAQGFGQAQARGNFTNNAALSQFGAGVTAQQLRNAAIGQNFNQGLQSTALGNAAVAQNFGQGFQAQGQQNAAIGQNFGQGYQAQNQQNSAIGQNFNQGLQASGFQNAAQGQDYAQQMGVQGLRNASIGQNQQAALAQQQAVNAAQAQGFGQNLQAQQAFNQAQAQNFGNQQIYQQAQNAAQNQRFNQGLQAGQFGNTAQQQALAQAISMRQMPLNEITALMSGSQIQNPQFSPYSGANIAPAPIANATQQQGQWNQGMYNMQVGQDNEMMGGLFKLGAAAVPLMMAS